MKVLFVHQNFPGQYLHLARYLGSVGGHEVVFITQRQDGDLPGVRKIAYTPQRKVTQGIHHYIQETEAGVLNAQAVARVAWELKQSGFTPDVMLAHNGWGELWYLKEIFPSTPLIGYFEFFYHLHGADVGFEPGSVLTADTGPRIRTKNIGNLLALDTVDHGQCPTMWQKSLYPKIYHEKLHVIHEGINTSIAIPDASAQFNIPDTDITLTCKDEVVTYVARNLEPYRGFPSFMQSLPMILKERSNAHVIVVGGDETSYGPGLGNGKTFREEMINTLGDRLDLTRIHFLGKVPYSSFIKILQISTVHIYLTYPFVLSWSMLEAMSSGCIILGSRTQPVTEVIRDKENGILVDIFNPDNIAEQAIRVISNRELFIDIRKKARQTIIDRYDLNSICLPAQINMLSWAIIKQRDLLR